MVRFELELALVSGELKVADLPDAWNAKYEEFLGITPPDDAQGVLQDVHWSSGAIGYFPTYALGNLLAVQYYNKIGSAHLRTLLCALPICIVRFELELAQVSGELKVADLPDAGNAKYEEFLGITPPDDAQGVLQDVHWSSGAIGYFPTYALGNLLAVQYYN